MDFDLDSRRARLGVGEFADFTLGPRDALEGPSGLWRAQLGTRWHQQLRSEADAQHPGSEFEVVIEGEHAHDGWTVTLNGRIDQLIRDPEGLTLREIKTVTRALPEDEAALRTDYPAYFIQLAAYAAMRRSAGDASVRAELVFVEVGGGLAQTIPLGPEDEALFRVQLARVIEFLELRRRARDRLRGLRFHPPFSVLRPGQESLQTRLSSALAVPPAVVLFEAPTGFGKTGVLLECALGQLRDGAFDRVLYLTGKSTGQLQVVSTLATMTSHGADASELAVWTVRPKSEHCVNDTFHCLRDACHFLDGMAARWQQSGLARFYLFEDQARDLESLRVAGRDAGICPYEITRAALAFNDVWVGDYNYVFAPANRGLFYQQPGFQPGRTLLLIDEAHNLPSRVAGAYSHDLTSAGAEMVLAALRSGREASTFVLAWEAWANFLAGLEPSPVLGPEEEAEARRHLAQLGTLVGSQALDYASLGSQVSDLLWRVPSLADQLELAALPLLWWCPRPGELSLTCLDAAPVIGPTLREYGGVVLVTATPGPADLFAQSLGLDVPAASDQPRFGPVPADMAAAPKRLGALNQRETRKLFSQLSRGAELLRLEEEKVAALIPVRAETPWRVGAYDVAFDLRVDTTYRQRAHHYDTTAATVAALHRGAVAATGASASPGQACVAVFFSSYAYASAIAAAVETGGSGLRVALQPRSAALAARSAWVEASLAGSDAIFLILGSSFAEGIDLLGGRVSHAIVVGPALPEVSAVQKARTASLASLGREAAFDRVYRVPGMQKVNQALGRLVRAPGQRARVLLHCRRFIEPEYYRLLATDYQAITRVTEDSDLEAWLARPLPRPDPPGIAGPAEPSHPPQRHHSDPAVG